MQCLFCYFIQYFFLCSQPSGQFLDEILSVREVLFFLSLLFFSLLFERNKFQNPLVECCSQTKHTTETFTVHGCTHAQFDSRN